MITLDRNQMQSVLLNIIINALDATDGRRKHYRTSGIGVSTSKPGQNGIEICVRIQVAAFLLRTSISFLILSLRRKTLDTARA